MSSQLQQKVPAFLLPKLTVTVETITVAVAHEYLKSNTKNRSVSRKRVKHYAQLMTTGRWHLNGEPIQFDTNGALMNGQHRLLACIMAGIPFTVVIVRGVDPASRPTIDTGKGRTAGDNITIEGGANSNRMAAIAKNVLAIKNGKGKDIVRYHEDHDVILKYWEENDELFQYGQKLTRPVNHLVPVSLASALYFLFAERDMKAAETFFEDLKSGLNLAATDPVYMLRETLGRLAGEKHKISKSELAARVIRTWNMRRRGQQSRSRLFGIVRDEFPEIV